MNVYKVVAVDDQKKRTGNAPAVCIGLCLLLMWGGLFLPIYTAQAETYTLVYQKQNHWVAQEDAAPLRALVKEAKKRKDRHFRIQLPADANPDLYLERLKILRKILQQNVNGGAIIEQIPGETPAPNMLVVIYGN